MRVLLLTNGLQIGGAERQAALWAQACVALGHDTRVVALEPAGRDFPLPDAASVTHLGKRGRRDIARTLRRVRREAAAADVVVAFQSFPALVCAVARVRVPWLVVAGNDPRHWGDTSRVPPRLLRWAFGRATIGTAPCQGIADCHEELGIRPARGWRVVANVVDDRAYESAGSGPREGALFVGRLVAVKDPQLAVEAAARAGAPLTVLGSGELRDDLERLAWQSADRAAIELRGFVADPWAAYAAARAVVVTSQYESFGNMIVEALACGTPVVSVDCDFGPREIIGDARFSRLVGRDPDEIATALREVLDRPYTDEERRECETIAARYSPAALRPVIAAALEAAR
jgi:glycosyltransferase involved in cell wall biosynthesis